MPGVVVTVVVEPAKYELQSALAMAIWAGPNRVARTWRRQLLASHSAAYVRPMRMAKAAASLIINFMIGALGQYRLPNSLQRRSANGDIYKVRHVQLPSASYEHAIRERQPRSRSSL